MRTGYEERRAFLPYYAARIIHRKYVLQNIQLCRNFIIPYDFSYFNTFFRNSHLQSVRDPLTSIDTKVSLVFECFGGASSTIDIDMDEGTEDIIMRGRDETIESSFKVQFVFVPCTIKILQSALE